MNVAYTLQLRKIISRTDNFTNPASDRPWSATDGVACTPAPDSTIHYPLFTIHFHEALAKQGFLLFKLFILVTAMPAFLTVSSVFSVDRFVLSLWVHQFNASTDHTDSTDGKQHKYVLAQRRGGAE